MTDSIFDTGNPDPGNSGEPPKLPGLPDNLKDLVGEGKKYASVEKALEALPHAQAHIERLEQEAKELRENVTRGVSAEEVMRTVQDLLKAERGQTPAATMDEAGIAGMLDRVVSERERKQAESANRNSVDVAMKGKFGEKAKEVFVQRATELGMSVQSLEAMAKSSPKAALELLGVKPAQGAPVAHSRSTINTEGLTQVRQDPAPRRLMTGGATQADIMAAWRDAGKPQT